MFLHLYNIMRVYIQSVKYCHSIIYIHVYIVPDTLKAYHIHTNVVRQYLPNPALRYTLIVDGGGVYSSLVVSTLTRSLGVKLELYYRVFVRHFDLYIYSQCTMVHAPQVACELISIMIHSLICNTHKTTRVHLQLLCHFHSANLLTTPF